MITPKCVIAMAAFVSKILWCLYKVKSVVTRLQLILVLICHFPILLWQPIEIILLHKCDLGIHKIDSTLLFINLTIVLSYSLQRVNFNQFVNWWKHNFSKKHKTNFSYIGLPHSYSIFSLLYKLFMYQTSNRSNDSMNIYLFKIKHLEPIANWTNLM